MREIRPFYSMLFLLSLLAFSPWAQAQIWAPSGNAYSQCRAVYDSKTRQGYPQSAAQDEFNACMSRMTQAEAADNPQQVQQEPSKSEIDSALGNYTQRSNSGSQGSGAAKSSGSNGKKTTPAKQQQQQQEASGGDCRESGCQDGYACYAMDGNRTSYACKPQTNAVKSNDGDSGSGSTPSYVTQCTQEYQELYEACRTETTEAVGLCDSKNNSGMNQVSTVAQKASLMLGQATASSIQAACSSAADLSAMANAAVAGFATYCNQGREDCNTACDKASSFLREKGDSCFSTSATEGGRQYDQAADNLNDQKKSCEALASKAQDAQQAIQNYAGTLQNSQQCASLTKATSDLCKANPRLPGCSTVATECTTTACICSKNPMDPQCTGGAGTGDTIGAGGVDSSTRLAGKGNTNIDMSGDIPNFGIEQGALNKDGTPAGIDGKQGGSAGIGGGGDGAGGGGRGGGGGGPGEEKNVNAGFYGSGGGGGFGSGSGAARGRGGYAGTGAGSNSKNGMPNLRSFLPGGKFDPRGVRGIAGATGPDGITGPHTDIWKKVNNRYKVMSPSLLP